MQKRNLLFVLVTLVFLSFSNIFAQEQNKTMPDKISKGVVNSLAVSLPTPIYPAAARAVKASGVVNVQVLIDKEGNVESAEAVSGHPLLRNSAVAAAREAKFKPTLLQNNPVKVTGVIVYNFVGEKDWMSHGVSFGYAEVNGIRNSIVLQDEFSDEQEQFNQLKQSSLEIQKAQLPNIIASIKAKLNAQDLWLFEYGIAKAKVLDSLSKGDENLILSNLAVFKMLAANSATGVQNYLIDKASKLAEFADKENISEEDRNNIRNYLY